MNTRHSPKRPLPYYHHPAAWPDETLLDQCTQAQGRSSGPGGQHRNKVSTLVVLTHRPTGLHAKAGERRSMIHNRDVALRRLRLLLATEHREGVPDGPIGSELLKSRRVKLKKKPEPQQSDPVLESLGVKLETTAPKQSFGLKLSPKHHDYPSILAEIMDVLAATHWKPSTAGTRLEISASQILKVVKAHPAALGKLNDERQTLGLKPLR